MQSKDIEICREIGQLIYDVAPPGSHKIVMRAELSAEGDHAKFEFDSIDSEGRVSWFTGGGKLNKALLNLLVKHREFFVSQNQPLWKKFVFSVDVEKGKFSLELAYD